MTKEIANTNKYFIENNDIFTKILEKAIISQIIQVPNDENHNSCICQSTIINNETAFSSIGEANPNNIPQSDICNIVQIAYERSLNNARNMTHLFKNKSDDVNVIDVDVINHNETNHQAQYSIQDKSKFKGGGAKPASEKQISLIHKLANEQGKNAQQIINSHSRNKNGLSGYEADMIIKELKNEIY